MKANTTPSEDSETFEVISSASSTSFPSAKNTNSNIQINEQTSSIRNRIRKLLPHRQSIDSSKTSPLFVKLQDANLRWWNSFHSQPEILRKDVQSTTKRIGLRLDQTQYLAVDNSNQIRSSIKNMKTCSSVIDNVIDCSKAILPTFKVCKLNASWLKSLSRTLYSCSSVMEPTLAIWLLRSFFLQEL